MNPYLPVIVAFLITRILSFTFFTVATEPQLILAYATSVRDRSLAETYRSTLTHPYAFTAANEQPPEYPQLTALFAVPPLWLADAMPGLGRLVSLRPRAAEFTPVEAAYEAALGLQILLVDAALLALVYLAARRLYPDDSRWLRAARLGLYVAASAIFAPVWFDRLDMLMGLVATAAILAFARGWPTVGYVVLIAGAGVKLVPLLLLPVWVLAASLSPGRGSFARRLGRESVVAGGILLGAVAILYLFGGGDRAFVFLQTHAGRGIECGSTYAPLVFLADPTTRVVFNHGGFHLEGALADRLVPFTTPLLLLLLAACLAVIARAMAKRSQQGLPVTAILPQAVLLLWLTFILAVRIGSPQFVIWLIPVMPLLPLRDRAEWRWTAWFLVLCALLTLIYPLAAGHVTGPRLAADVWAGSTPFGLFLVTARSLILAGLAVWLVRSCPGALRRPAE